MMGVNCEGCHSQGSALGGKEARLDPALLLRMPQSSSLGSLCEKERTAAVHGTFPLAPERRSFEPECSAGEGRVGAVA